jgi:PAS domain S-box-containing protein
LLRQTRAVLSRARVLLVAAACVSQLVALPPAHALDSSTPLAQLVSETWGTKDGLPEGAVLSLHQAADGYLWLGTQSGLARFDGVRFAPFEEGTLGLKQHSFGRDLFEGRHGDMWAALVGGVAHFDGTAFTFFDTDQGLDHPFVYALAPAPDDSLWVGSGGTGVWLLRDGRFSKHPAYIVDPTLPGNVHDLAMDEQGTLWVATDRGALALIGGTVAQRFAGAEGLPSPVANVVLSDKHGTVWIGTHHGLVNRSVDAVGGFATVPLFASDDITALFEDRGGNVWVGTRTGALGRVGAQRSERENGLPSEDRGGILAFTEDDDGSLWVGRSNGLERYRSGVFKTLGRREGLPDEQLLNLAERPGGGLWLLDGAGRLLIQENQSVREIAPEGTVPGDGMLGLLGGEDGSLWIGGTTLRHYHDDTWDRFSNPGGEFTVLVRDGQGLIVAQTAGDGTSTLSRFENGQFAPIPAPIRLLHVQRIYRDRRGELWIGTGGSGLVRIGTQGTRTFTTTDGLPHNVVYGIAEDDVGDMWVATRRGLARVRGNEVLSLAGVAGVPRLSPLHVQRDALGYLWVTADDGIYRIALADLNAAADGRPDTVPSRKFTTADGLRTVHVSWRASAVVQTADGQLWYATERGLASADPRTVVEPTAAPNVTIEDMVIGPRRWTAGRAVPFVLADDRIEIRYTAPSPSRAADLRFRYRLIDNDSDWIDAQKQRTAHYTNLAPGRYEFHVVARWVRGPWSDREATVLIDVKPRWYQTTVVRLLLLLLGCTVLAAVLWLQVRRGRAREALLVRRVSERTEDLHREIVERRHAEEEVRRLNDDLEARVRERTAQLEVANLALAEDVVVRRRAEAELASEKERLAATLSSIAEGVITADHAGRIVMMNPVAERATGWPLANAQGYALFSVFQIFDRTTRTPLPNPAADILGDARTGAASVHRVLLSSRSGGEILIDASAAPIQDSAGQVVGAVLVFRDVTESTRTEEQLHKTQKLEAVGVLAGGIAHDFNNLLTGIFGNINMARTTMTADAPAASWLDEAAAVLEDARGLTRQLLTFSAGGRPATEPHAIGEILRRSARFVLSGSRVSADLNIPDDLWPCDIDPLQIRQAVDNIVLNARQAMPDGGHVRIGACNTEVATGAAPRLCVGRYVEIVIADDGPGIPTNIQGKVFDPFFSTRPNGNGLGLASVHSILTQHGGTVDLESAPGAGTSFRLRLPASDAAPRRRSEHTGHLEPAPVTQAATRVLVMDDHPEILRFMRAVLERKGCAVDLAADSHEALALFRRARADGRPYGLAILDLTIAGGPGGVETAAELKAIDPTLRAIASSGYSNDDIMAEPEKFGFVGTLPKPYTLEELVAAVESALRGQ